MKIFAVILASILSTFNMLAKQINLSVIMPNNTPTPSAIETPAPISRLVSSPKPLNTPSVGTTETGININDFNYPGSTVISYDNFHLSLQSTDDTQKIINWYEDRVNGRYSGRSDSVSNVNGNTNAKLEAQNSSETIDISISKDNTKLYTAISIVIK